MGRSYIASLAGLPWLAMILGCLPFPAAFAGERFANAVGEMKTPQYVGFAFLGTGRVGQPTLADLYGVSLVHAAIDSDGDGRVNLLDPDNDNDALDDLDEIEVCGTNPNKLDTDDDDMPDGWEVAEGFNPLSTADADQDADGDGASNLQEWDEATDPHQYVLRLVRGWNLVSIARVPVDYTVSGILGDAYCGPVWCWSGQRLTHADSLTPLDGYWVYCPSETEKAVDLGAMEFPSDADSDGDGFSDSQEIDRDTDVNQYVIHLNAGWNLVSLARRPHNNTVEALFPHMTRGPAWFWAGDHYEKAEDLRPLVGYWLFSPTGGDPVINLP